ncbi:MAG: hypothetical protein HY651_01265 [Acidobacteria bacterium]|nr:hypothetical protein [Acidobacteriota bacterium]
MNSILGPQRLEHKALRRWLAAFLVFLVVSDLGYHLAESFLNSPDSPAGALVTAYNGIPEPPDGCGIPGHDATPFHHHHFPTLVSQTSPPVPLLALAWISVSPSDERVHSSSVIAIGRAPPARF